MSPRRILDTPTLSPASECAPTSPEPKEEVRVRGWGSPNSDDWRKGLALRLFCVRGDCVTFTNLAMTPLPLNMNERHSESVIIK
jgi:hypothetical protein